MADILENALEGDFNPGCF